MNRKRKTKYIHKENRGVTKKSKGQREKAEKVRNLPECGEGCVATGCAGEERENVVGAE